MWDLILFLIQCRNLNGNSLSGQVPAALGGRLLHRASFKYVQSICKGKTVGSSLEHSSFPCSHNNSYKNQILILNNFPPNTPGLGNKINPNFALEID